MIKRLVNDRSPRQPPADVLARLREIDPTAELVYFGGGRWKLGSVRPNRRRRRIVEGMARAERKKGRPNPALLYLAELGVQGFSPIATYVIDGEPDGRIVEDFRERDRNWRERPEETFEENLDLSDISVQSEEHKKGLIERISVVARDRVLWRGRKTPFTRNAH